MERPVATCPIQVDTKHQFGARDRNLLPVCLFVENAEFARWIWNLDDKGRR